MLGTSAGHDNGIGHQIPAAADEVAANRRQPFERAAGRRDVPACGAAGGKIVEEQGKRLLAGTEKDGVGVLGGLVRKRRDVQPAQSHERASGAIVIGKPVGALSIRYVDQDHNEVGKVVQMQRRDVFVFEHRLVIRPQIRGQCSQAKRSEERVFDRTPVRTRRFSQRGKNELDSSGSHLGVQVGDAHTLYCKVIFNVNCGRLFDLAGACAGLLGFFAGDGTHRGGRADR